MEKATLRSSAKRPNRAIIRARFSPPFSMSLWATEPSTSIQPNHPTAHVRSRQSPAHFPRFPHFPPGNPREITEAIESKRLNVEKALRLTPKKSKREVLPTPKVKSFTSKNRCGNHPEHTKSLSAIGCLTRIDPVCRQGLPPPWHSKIAAAAMRPEPHGHLCMSNRGAQ